MRRQAENFDGKVAPARDSATLVLLRDAARGPEVFLMRRRATMEFAPGMHVFPGGAVEESDFDSTTPWLGPERVTWARAFGCDPDLAGALVVAAIRETFEETGVLLAGPDAQTIVTTPADVDELRRAVEHHRLPFTRLLADRGLFLRTDLMAPWAHWITPEFAPRRYDTRFFVGILPAEQTLGTMSYEADAALWLSLPDAITSARNGVIDMMSPTLHVCRQLHETAFGSLVPTAWSRRIVTVAPRVVEVDGKRFFDQPPESEC